MAEIAKKIERHFTRGLIQVDTFNRDKRTVDVVFATDTPVMTYDWDLGRYWEILSFERGHVRTGRLEKGLPALDNHNRYGSVKEKVLGVVESYEIDPAKKEGRATIKISQRADLKDFLQDLEDGIIRNISVGYDVFVYERQNPIVEGEIGKYLAIDWEPQEISFVPVGADPDSGTRSKEGEKPDENKLREIKILTKNTDMTEEEKAKIAAERKRSIDITKAVVAAQLSADFARSLIEDDAVTSDEQISARIAAEVLRTKGAPTPTPTPTPAPAPAPTISEAERAEVIRSERYRTSEINALGLRMKSDPAFVKKLIDDGISIESARTQLQDKFFESDPFSGHRNIIVGKEETEKKREIQSIALQLRATPADAKILKPEEVSAAREFRGMSLLDMAREAIVLAGGSHRGMSGDEIARAAFNQNRDAAGMHSTSDFPIILGNTINRTLRRAYELYPQTFKQWAKESSVKDFRPVTRTQISGLTKSFKKVVEGGEYEYGSLTEGKESYSVVKYGQKIATTWEMIINDDLGAFGRIPQAIANKAAMLEADIVYGILSDNAAMEDGIALFHADHNNLETGSAINIATMQLMRALIRKQTGLEGDKLNLLPKYIIVGPDKELSVHQFILGAYNPVEAAELNPSYNKSLIPIIEPRIEGNEWYLTADPNQIDTVEYAYLEGHNGLFTEQRQGFDVDGLEIKARLVFGAKALDFRGMAKNPGE